MSGHRGQSCFIAPPPPPPREVRSDSFPPFSSPLSSSFKSNPRPPNHNVWCACYAPSRTKPFHIHYLIGHAHFKVRKLRHGFLEQEMTEREPQPWPAHSEPKALVTMHPHICRVQDRVLRTRPIAAASGRPRPRRSSPSLPPASALRQPSFAGAVPRQAIT